MIDLFLYHSHQTKLTSLKMKHMCVNHELWVLQLLFCPIDKAESIFEFQYRYGLAIMIMIKCKNKVFVDCHLLRVNLDRQK